MSAKKIDKLTDLKPGRYDYQIKVRVIRKWRGATITGEVFKGFNIILLDNTVSPMLGCTNLIQLPLAYLRCYNCSSFLCREQGFTLSFQDYAFNSLKSR